MSKLSAKTQKGLLIVVLAAICVVLAVAVFSFIGGSSEKEKSDIIENTSENVTVGDIKADDKVEVSVPDVVKTSATGAEKQVSSNVVLDISKKQDVEVP